ncbi:MAG: hypothetical protein FWD71_12350 [Oscillospiraceae bacterium]|nr:hypothetical protein [Oscillospiraceae bacterium]
MKKFLSIFKSKKALAILSVVIIACVAMGGTFSWFVVQGGGGGTANFTAAYITVDTQNSVIKPINIVSDGSGGFTAQPYNNTKWTMERDITNKDPIILYPSEGLESTLDATVDHNRGVVVRIDYNLAGTGAVSIPDQLDLIAQTINENGTALTDASTNNFTRWSYFNVASGVIDNTPINSVDPNSPSVSAPLSNDIYSYFDVTVDGQAFWATPGNFNASFPAGVQIWNNGEGTMFVYIPAIGDGSSKTPVQPDPQSPTSKLGITFQLGIKGMTYNQNYFMYKGLSINAVPTVTAVQATKAALSDVFADDLAMVGNGTVVLSDWFAGLDWID